MNTTYYYNTSTVIRYFKIFKYFDETAFLDFTFILFISV